jgi:hypothetical protein
MPLVAVGCMLLWMVIQLLVESFTERPVNVWGSLLPHLLLVPLVLLFVYILGIVAYPMVIRIRYAMVLEGTILMERIGVRREAVDILTAEICVRWDAAQRTAQFVARDPNTGAEVMVLVRRGEDFLPAAELAALADAVARRRVRSAEDEATLATLQKVRGLAGAPVEPSDDPTWS